MKKFLLIFLAAVCAGFFACSMQNGSAIADVAPVPNNNPAQPLPPKDKKPVLVELFTSEGCSSCPPADRVLAELDKTQPNPDAEVIALELHVDYWNSIGWKDEFSSAMFSQRQNLYGQKFKLNSIYTPQMVVDGQSQFVGSDLNGANKYISESAKVPKGSVEIAGEKDNLKIKISDLPKHENATIYLAITEDDLASNVKGGENSGKKLTHTAVVRELKSIGTLSAEQNEIALETVLQYQPDWKKENLKAVIFVQDNTNRKVLAVNRKSDL